jgi:hypothetical protein
MPWASACSSSPGTWPPRPSVSLEHDRAGAAAVVGDGRLELVADAIVISPVSSSRNSREVITASDLPPIATKAVSARPR